MLTQQINNIKRKENNKNNIESTLNDINSINFTEFISTLMILSQFTHLKTDKINLFNLYFQ